MTRVRFSPLPGWTEYHHAGTPRRNTAMSNYPTGTSISDPNAPWNEQAFDECGVCGSDHAPRRTCESCHRKACSDCRASCDDCGAWTCRAHLEDGFCAECAAKFATTNPTPNPPGRR